MADTVEGENTPPVNSDEKNPSPTIGQRIIRLPHLLIKILFPSTIFASFFVSSIIPSMANSLIPMFFAGNIPAAESLAITSQFMFISIVLKVIHEGVGNSLFHFVGVHYERNKPLAISAFNLSLLVLLIAGMALTVMILLFTPQFVKLIDTPASISEATKHYFYTSALSFIPALFTTAFTNYLFISTSKWLAISQVVIVLVSFSINFFTFGRQSISLHWSIDKLGIYNVVQSTATMLVSVGFVLLTEKMGPITFFMKASFIKDLKMNFREFFSVSWGNFADSIVRNFFYFFVTLKFINHLGKDISGAWNLFNSIIWGIILLPAFAVANLIRVQIGHQCSKSTIKKVIKEGGICLMAWMIVMIVVTGTVWSTLASFFSKSNQKIALISENMLHDMGWVFVIFAYNNAVNSFFLATGKAEYIFYQSLAANLIVYLLPWILNLFDILTPTYWLIMGLYIAGMLISCCLTSYFGVIVWKLFSDDQLKEKNKTVEFPW
ncbi:hypothetical protein HA402_006182 [Bradysia odoriphaga]|nr:hypothetical protein HA402_006182 [Bradysia odoriphaga]